MAAQFRARVLRQRSPFRCTQAFELVLGFAQHRLEGANAEAREDGLHLVHQPRLLSDQILPLTVRTPGVLLLDRRDRYHAAMPLLAAQPTEKGPHQQFRIEAISLRTPMFARHRDARGMNDISLDIVRPQPARQPEAVAASLISHDDAFDRAASLAGFSAPTMQELQQSLLLGIELLKRLAFDPGDKRCNEPLRLAHLDHGDDRAILLEGGEGPARIKMLLRHGGAPSVAVEQRQRCHALAARPIASAQDRTHAMQRTAYFVGACEQPSRTFARQARRRLFPLRDLLDQRLPLCNFADDLRTILL